MAAASSAAGIATEGEGIGEASLPINIGNQGNLKTVVELTKDNTDDKQCFTCGGLTEQTCLYLCQYYGARDCGCKPCSCAGIN